MNKLIQLHEEIDVRVMLFVKIMQLDNAKWVVTGVANGLLKYFD